MIAQQQRYQLVSRWRKVQFCRVFEGMKIHIHLRHQELAENSLDSVTTDSEYDDRVECNRSDDE